MTDGSVQLRLLPALDATVTHYYLVVVPDELAQDRRPQEFTLDEVRAVDTHVGWLGGETIRASDLRSSGRGFDSRSDRYQAT